MTPIFINNKWYIDLTNDEDGYTLLVDPNDELSPLSFNSYENVVSYIQNFH